MHHLFGQAASRRCSHRSGDDNVQYFSTGGQLQSVLGLRDVAYALSFYSFNTWTKVATGTRLNEVEKKKIRNALKN
jgi:hypothetical protein